MNHSGILILAEYNEQGIRQSTLSAIAAASELPGEITLLFLGEVKETVIQAARQLTGVNKVWICEASAYQHDLAENVAALVADIGKTFSYILAAATSFGKNILPRVAALLDVSQISDVMRIIKEDVFLHPIYAGNVLETVQTLDPIRVLTIRSTAFQYPSTNANTASLAALEKLTPVFDLKMSTFLKQEVTPRERPELTTAEKVVAGGRGFKTRENFKWVIALADQLGAAIAASRAAVDAGFVSNEYQVGQTGKIVAPELYIAIGISGAIQHIAGMKDSRIIVAINQDPDAPIFQIADYGLVGDLFQIIPALIQELAIQMDKL